MTTWMESREEPCKFGCAVWIGRHFHTLRNDGTIGTVVVTEEPGLYIADIEVDSK